MSKKNKPFQNINSALAAVWGTPTTGGRGISVKKAVNARRAGVTIDHPLTQMAQSLAAEIRADEVAKAKAADPRSPFEKQYDIQDNVAHITPEQFYGLFLLEKIQRIKNRAHTISIDDGQGLSVDFTFNTIDIEDKCLKVATSQDIIQLGLSGIISKGNKMVIQQDGQTIGILEFLSTPAGLMHHSQIISANTKPSMENKTALMSNPAELSDHSGNGSRIFASVSDLISKLKKHFDEGIELTADTFGKRQDGALKLGTVWHPERVGREYCHENSYNIKRRSLPNFRYLIKECHPYVPDENVSLFISRFFNGAAGYELTYKGNPIAIVLRADLPEPPKKTLG